MLCVRCSRMACGLIEDASIDKKLVLAALCKSCMDREILGLNDAPKTPRYQGRDRIGIDPHEY